MTHFQHFAVLGSTFPYLRSSTMDTARPTARAAHAAFHLGECLIDADASRLRFLTGDDPVHPHTCFVKEDLLIFSVSAVQEHYRFS